MSKLNSSLEKELQIPAFSQANLFSLIKDNKSMLERELDTSEDITIHVEPNIDFDLRIDMSTQFRVPAFYLPIDKFSLYTLSNLEKQTLKEALYIQKEASQDSPICRSCYSHSIFRKLATAVAMLENLLILPEMQLDEFRVTKYVLEKLYQDAIRKLKATEIKWKYKDLNNQVSSINYNEYDSRPLLLLDGGDDLFNLAVKDSLSFNIFEYITNSEKKEKEEVEENYQPRLRIDKRPIVLNLHAFGTKSFSSYGIAERLFDFDEEAFEFVGVDSMDNFISLMDTYKRNNWLKDIMYIIIDSAPPYFSCPSFEEFQLMMKYDIYNRGLCYPGLDYDDGCVDDIKGILRLIKGEYKELPKPIVLSDFSSISEKYSSDECYAASIIDDQQEEVARIKKLIKDNN